MRNFNEKSWNEILGKHDWNSLEKIEDLDDLVKNFTDLVTESLDEIAPIKTFSVKTKYIFGLSSAIKEMMKKRDKARKMAIKCENRIFHPKYYIQD